MKEKWRRGGWNALKDKAAIYWDIIQAVIDRSNVHFGSVRSRTF